MSDDFWSLGTLALLLFLGLEDLGRVEVCSREMWQRCGHCWRQKCQHVADLFAATVEVSSLPSLSRELKLGLACLTAGLELDASKFQTLQLQTSDIICLGRKVLKLRSQGCRGDQRRILLKCLTMATRQSKQSLARGSMVITVEEEIFELQVEWMDASVFLRLAPQREPDGPQQPSTRSVLMDILHVSTPPFLHSLSLSVSADSKWRKAGFSPGLMKCPENFLKSLRRGLFCVISISQQPNGTSHSLAALQLEGVRQNDFYRHRAEMFNRLTGWH